MASRMFRGIGLASALVLGAASCGGPTPTARPTASPATAASQISVANNTTVAVTVAVNGTVVETVLAGTTELAIPVVVHAPPWTVEARSPTGRVLVTLTVEPTDQVSGTASVGNAAFLACGDLLIWAGAVPVDFPRPSQASLPPCD